MQDQAAQITKVSLHMLCMLLSKSRADNVIIWSVIIDSAKSSDTFNIEHYVVETDKWPSSFWIQYKTLLRRAFLNSKNRILSKSMFIQTAAQAVIVGLIWFSLPKSEITYNDRLGSVS